MLSVLREISQLHRAINYNYNILHLLFIINGKKTFLAGKYHGFCKHITHFAGKQLKHTKSVITKPGLSRSLETGVECFFKQ